MISRASLILLVATAGVLTGATPGHSVRYDATLKSRGGVYEVNVEVNGAAIYPFVVDSGAAEVSLTLDVFRALTRQGVVDSEDMLEPKLFTDASGNTKEEERVRLRSLRIGPITVRNVEASIGGLEVPMLLLGQSFLSKVHWRMDVSRRVLEISDEASVSVDAPSGTSANPAASSPARSAEAIQAPEQVVREYFGHLGTQRIAEAASAWVRMDPEKLSKLVGEQSLSLSSANTTVLNPDSALVWVDFVATQGDGARARHCGPIRLILTDGAWKISSTRDVRRVGAGESCQTLGAVAPGMPVVDSKPSTADCSDWRQARFPDCPTGSLRTYWGRVRNHEIQPAVGQWVHVNNTWLSQVIRDTESVDLQDLTVASQSSSRARVHVRVTTKSRGRSPSLWCGTATLLWIDGEWKIWSLPLREASAVAGCPRG